MALLSKDAIFSQDDSKTEDVSVPEWGGTVRVRSLTGAERDDFEASMIHQVGNTARANMRNMRAKLVSLSAINEDGSPLFAAADVIKLGQRSASALDRLFSSCQRLSGLGEDDVKELAEGFGDAPNGASTSA